MAAAGSAARGLVLSRQGLCRLVGPVVPRRRVTAAVKGSGDAWYFVFARWVDGAVRCICSCPDSRPGYCKHAAAALEESAKDRNKGKKRSWLAAAYGGGGGAEPEPGEPDEGKRFGEEQAALLASDEAVLRGLGRPGLVRLRALVPQVALPLPVRARLRAERPPLLHAVHPRPHPQLG